MITNDFIDWQGMNLFIDNDIMTSPPDRNTLRPTSGASPYIREGWHRHMKLRCGQRVPVLTVPHYTMNQSYMGSSEV